MADTNIVEQGSTTTRSKQNTDLEKIRPDLNFEKWSIWQPAHSKNKKPRTFTRTSHDKQGIEQVQKVTVDSTALLGTLTTEEQKTLYALLYHWEKNARSDKLTYFSVRGVAKTLKKKWGTNVIESLTKSLTKLRAIPIYWSNSYVDGATKEIVEELEPFTILADLKIVKRKKDGHVTKEAGYFRFHERILGNLLSNYTKPLILETVLSFKSEIAQLLYTHLDLILFDKRQYERRSKELFNDLGIEGTAYIKPSKRKQTLQPALKELCGKPLTSGYIISATLEETVDQKDYKIVIRKGSLKAALPNPQTTTGNGRGEEHTEPPKLPRADKVSEQGHALVGYFHQLFHGNSTVSPSTKASAQAISLIAQYGEEQARYIIAYSHREAPATSYKPLTFGGIMHYTAKALADFEYKQLERQRTEQQRLAEEARAAEEAARERELEDHRQRAQAFFDQLPQEEQARLLRHYRTVAIEQNPNLARCNEDVIERHVIRLILMATTPPPEQGSDTPLPTQNSLFSEPPSDSA